MLLYKVLPLILLCWVSLCWKSCLPDYTSLSWDVLQCFLCKRYRNDFVKEQWNWVDATLPRFKITQDIYFQNLLTYVRIIIIFPVSYSEFHDIDTQHNDTYQMRLSPYFFYKVLPLILSCWVSLCWKSCLPDYTSLSWDVLQCFMLLYKALATFNTVILSVIMLIVLVPQCHVLIFCMTLQKWTPINIIWGNDSHF
jgi:hypothetical protein